MADPVEPPVEEFDPLREIASAHLKQMQAIAHESFDKAKVACDDVLLRLKRNVGLRDAVLDKTLAALGVKESEDKE